jgi:hypothetical protein
VRGLTSRGDRDHPDPVSGIQGQRLHRTVHWDRPDGDSRSVAYHRRARRFVPAFGHHPPWLSPFCAWACGACWSWSSRTEESSRTRTSRSSCSATRSGSSDANSMLGCGIDPRPSEPGPAGPPLPPGMGPRPDPLLRPPRLVCTTPAGLTDWMGQSAGFATHGPMPPIRVIEYRTTKPGSDPSGAGTSASGET